MGSTPQSRMTSRPNLAALEKDCLAFLRGHDRASVAVPLVKRLAEGLSATVIAHRPERTASGWRSEQMIPSDDPVARDVAARTTRFLENAPYRYTFFDPLLVEARFANQVFGHGQMQKLLASGQSPAIREVYVQAGVLSHSQVRLVSSDGRFMLQWLGLFRKEPFTKAEEIVLIKLAPKLVPRLMVERQLWGGVPGSFETLGQLLELVSLPAFVVDGLGRIALLNGAGHAMLEREPALGHEIVAAAGGSPSPRIASVTPLASEGVPRHHIVLVSDDAPRTEARLSATLRDVGLSEAEGRVFRCLVAGDPNKDIATKLACSVRTVEVHVTTILAKCRVDSRARLIAWFWTR